MNSFLTSAGGFATSLFKLLLYKVLNLLLVDNSDTYPLSFDDAIFSNRSISSLSLLELLLSSILDLFKTPTVSKF